MKRKLQLHRETLLNLENHKIQEAKGGSLSFQWTCGSCERTCTCFASCGTTCGPSCFTC
jgi:hypothetical protein